MQFSDQELIDKVQERDTRAISRLITLSENGVPRARKVQAELFKKSGRAQVIGITGAPGAGKSTLVDQLGREWSERGKQVAILAVDPSSPFSGGAILGDRVRMDRSLERSDIFIRSMATRGSLGGLSRATVDAIQILDAAGFDVILVETVGVGQAEVDIVRTADTCIVVLVPGMGDSVQLFKAGIIEIADLYVINKSDRDGADLLQKDLRVLLSLNPDKENAWTPPIVRSIATQGTGTAEIIEKVSDHQGWLRTSERGKEKKLRIIRDTIVKISQENVLQQLLDDGGKALDKMVADCYAHKTDPYTAAKKLVKSL